MSVLLGVIVGLLMLMLLVTLHEFGHFIAARRNGVEVEEFGICFPPRAIAWRKVDGKWRRLKRKEWDNPPGKGLIISLNWLPIGGFCQMHGESDDDKRKHSFGQATYWQKVKILFAGVGMNWLTAFLIFTVLAFMGMPHFLDNQFVIESDVVPIATTNVKVTSVMEGSPAKKLGLQEGDVIRRLQSEDREESVYVRMPDDLLEFDKEHAGETIYITFIRGEQSITDTLTLNNTDAEYLLGAGISGGVIYKSTWSAPIVGAMTTLQLTGETFKGVGELIWNACRGVVMQLSPSEETRTEGTQALEKAGDSVSGPVGIVGILFPAFTESGPRNLLFLVALISVSLACMNVLPIPALDGGRWLLISIARLRKKKLSKKAEEKIVGRAFIVLLAIILIVTILDILRLVG